MNERFKTCSAVMLMLIRKDNNGQEEILLQKRKNTGYMDGYWDFSASGHVEDNEPMKMAMLREASEELGINIKNDDLEKTVQIIMTIIKNEYNSKNDEF